MPVNKETILKNVRTDHGSVENPQLGCDWLSI